MKRGVSSYLIAPPTAAHHGKKGPARGVQGGRGFFWDLEKQRR
jgi:hypothetical protein